MLVGGRLFLFLIIIWSSSLLLNTKSDFLNTKERRKRHIFPLLGYLHGYKTGQNFALQLPRFVVSPVIIVPVNQQQSVNIQNSNTDESFQENGGTFQTNVPAKLTLNLSLEDIETSSKLSQENCTSDDDVTSINDTLRQINAETTSSTEIVSEKDDLTSITDSLETNEAENFKITEPTTSSVFYPDSEYNNEKLISLQLTTSTEPNLQFINTTDKRENVTFETNNTDIETSEVENVDNKLHESSSRVVSFQLTTERYPRPNTRYNPYSFWHNAMVDQLSITTNSYREEEIELPLPPRYDDRWRRFSSLSKVVLPASGFKPLAGLYYDGFLHKSLARKSGFIPFDNYNYV